MAERRLYHCPRSTEFLEINRRLRQLHPEIVSRTAHAIAELGGHITRDPKTDLLTLNDELVISLVLARCQMAANGQQRWRSIDAVPGRRAGAHRQQLVSPPDEYSPNWPVKISPV